MDDLNLTPEEYAECLRRNGYQSSNPDSDSDTNFDFDEICQEYRPPEVDLNTAKIIDIGPGDETSSFEQDLSEVHRILIQDIFNDGSDNGVQKSPRILEDKRKKFEKKNQGQNQPPQHIPPLLLSTYFEYAFAKKNTKDNGIGPERSTSGTSTSTPKEPFLDSSIQETDDESSASVKSEPSNPEDLSKYQKNVIESEVSTKAILDQHASKTEDEDSLILQTLDNNEVGPERSASDASTSTSKVEFLDSPKQKTDEESSASFKNEPNNLEGLSKGQKKNRRKKLRRQMVVANETGAKSKNLDKQNIKSFEDLHPIELDMRFIEFVKFALNFYESVDKDGDRTESAVKIDEKYGAFEPQAEELGLGMHQTDKSRSVEEICTVTVLDQNATNDESKNEDPREDKDSPISQTPYNLDKKCNEIGPERSTSEASAIISTPKAQFLESPIPKTDEESGTLFKTELDNLEGLSKTQRKNRRRKMRQKAKENSVVGEIQKNVTEPEVGTTAILDQHTNSEGKEDSRLLQTDNNVIGPEKSTFDASTSTSTPKAQFLDSPIQKTDEESGTLVESEPSNLERLSKNQKNVIEPEVNTKAILDPYVNNESKTEDKDSLNLQTLDNNEVEPEISTRTHQIEQSWLEMHRIHKFISGLKEVCTVIEPEMGAMTACLDQNTTTGESKDETAEEDKDIPIFPPPSNNLQLNDESSDKNRDSTANLEVNCNLSKPQREQLDFKMQHNQTVESRQEEIEANKLNSSKKRKQKKNKRKKVTDEVSQRKIKNTHEEGTILVGARSEIYSSFQGDEAVKTKAIDYPLRRLHELSCPESAIFSIMLLLTFRMWFFLFCCFDVVFWMFVFMYLCIYFVIKFDCNL